MIALGVGCRKGCEAEEIVALARTALEAHGLALQPGDVMASGWMKTGEQGIIQAATILGVPVVFVAQDALEAMAPWAVTRSAHVAAVHGLPSVAETAALVAAGMNAKLLGARRVSASASCAVARGDGV
jgi:cobalt-precorrin 5A hydrolase